MQIYVGQTRGKWMTARLAHLGWGECTCRGELPPRRVPWFYDCGAYRDFVADRPFDEVAFLADMAALYARGDQIRPDFLVAPDLVAQGPQSLDFSRQWLPRLTQIAPVFVAVQDGMPITPATVAGFDGVFVGGSLEWKLRTGAVWCELGRSLGMPVHIGRVGTASRVDWARQIGASSIDSALPLWSAGAFERFARAVASTQCLLFAPADRG